MIPRDCAVGRRSFSALHRKNSRRIVGLYENKIDTYKQKIDRANYTK